MESTEWNRKVREAENSQCPPDEFVRLVGCTHREAMKHTRNGQLSLPVAMAYYFDSLSADEDQVMIPSRPLDGSTTFSTASNIFELDSSDTSNLSVEDTTKPYHPAFVKARTPKKTPQKVGNETAPLTPSQLRALEYRHQAVELFEAHGESC